MLFVIQYMELINTLFEHHHSWVPSPTPLLFVYQTLAHVKVSQAFSLPICTLEGIKYWRWQRLGEGCVLCMVFCAPKSA